ncbi:MAG: hypothetical protein [Bacteriophage sp.]|nr:MAG: hypothetical protein [Bacteriophage sp.]
MITFRPIQIGNVEYLLDELTFNDGIKISVIDKKLDEMRLSEFLRNALVEKHDPLSLSLQHRYLLLLKYLEAQHELSLLQIRNIDFSRFYIDGDYIDEKTVDDISIRQLNGRDLEFIERNCTSKNERIACAIAIQLGYDDLNILPPVPSRELQQADYEKAIINRISEIKSKKMSDFDKIYDDFVAMSLHLMNLVSYSFTDTGIALRGTDDALYRFCPLIGTGRFFK